MRLYVTGKPECPPDDCHEMLQLIAIAVSHLHLPICAFCNEADHPCKCTGCQLEMEEPLSEGGSEQKGLGHSWLQHLLAKQV